jgi:hypothetical protein
MVAAAGNIFVARIAVPFWRPDAVDPGGLL